MSSAKRPSFIAVLILSVSVVTGFSQNAPTLTVGSGMGPAGNVVEVPVNLAVGSYPVGTIQFEVTFPTALAVESVVAGTAAAAAGKAVTSNTSSPGLVRFLLFGLNTNSVGSGCVALLRVAIAAGTPPGQVVLTIRSIVAADLNGYPVTLAGGNGSITVLAPADTAPPVIISISTTVRSRNAVITWVTDEASDSQVEYGTSSTLGTTSELRKTLVTSHSGGVSGLKANTDYQFRVKSRDAAGNLAVSQTHSFRTTTSSGRAASMFYPRLVSQNGSTTSPDGSEYTGIAVVNLGSIDAILTFTAYDPQGAEIIADGLVNPAEIGLAPGMQLPLVDAELFGSGMTHNGRIGWIKLDSSATGVSGFTLMFNGSLSVLDGAPAFVTPVVSSILSEVEDEGFTQIHIANPNEDQVPIRVDLVRQDGTARASADRIVNGNGVIADYLTELFPDTPLDSSDYIRILSGRGVAPFEMLGKPAQYLEGLNGQDTTCGSKVLYSPQYAVGGPWRSTLSVINLDATPGTVTFRLLGDDGAQIGPTRVLPIDGNGKILLKDQSFFVTPVGIVQGYVNITADVNLSGSVVFGDPGRRVFAAALPLASTLQDEAIFGHIASSETYFTGLALLNPSDSAATVTLEVFASDGTLQGTVTETIEARHRVSKLLTQYFPALAGQNRNSGYVRMASDNPVAAFALFGTHDLSVLSAVPAQPAPRSGP